MIGVSLAKAAWNVEHRIASIKKGLVQQAISRCDGDLNTAGKFSWSSTKTWPVISSVHTQSNLRMIWTWMSNMVIISRKMATYLDVSLCLFSIFFLSLSPGWQQHHGYSLQWLMWITSEKIPFSGSKFRYSKRLSFCSWTVFKQHVYRPTLRNTNKNKSGFQDTTASWSSFTTF
jgi:hypothetical protein